MSLTLTIAAALALTPVHARAQSRNLDIYWVDVEGGAATLVVSPSGESLLYDSGWEVGDRDARRIADAARTAGISKIDYFVLSHFHADHAGGIVALSKLLPLFRSRRLHRAGQSAMAGGVPERLRREAHDPERGRSHSVEGRAGRCGGVERDAHHEADGRTRTESLVRHGGE
jgi:beta-lactamase superfamily II metal-dependent hydrolase